MDDPLLGFAVYAHVAPRRNSITPARQRAFIAHLAASGIVTQAAKQVGVSLEALYRLRGRAGAEGFAAAWDEAVDRGMARLEDCALERAIAGEVRPVVSRGKVVSHWTRYDTALLIFLLRQRRSARFGADRTVAPGSAEWRRLRAEWEAETYVDEEVILASINAKLAAMKKNEAAWAREAAEIDWGEDGVPED